MRDISSAVETAITDTDSYRMYIQATIDPSRTFFNTLTDDDPYDGADYSVPTDTPTGQCMIYSSQLGKAITFIVNPSGGAIVAMEQGSASQHSLGITADEDTKPAAYALGNGTAYLWYWNGSNVVRVTVNLSSWGVSGSTTLTMNNLPVGRTIVGGSPHALSATQIAFTYETSIGGLGVAYYDGSWNHWPGRFISPNTLTVTDWSIYSTAAILNGEVFIYSTDITTGETRVVKHIPYKNHWSDSQIALAADLSRFCVGNAIVANGYIHIAGQFHRTEDLANAKVYSLAVRSDDGINFAWDRFSLLSSLGYQFQIALSNTTLYASDRNSVGTSPLSYYYSANPPDRVVLEPPSDFISFRIENATSGILVVRSYDEELIDDPTIKKGSRCMIEIGYQTATGIGYTAFGYFSIANVRWGFKNGARRLELALQDEGTWKTAQIAFPFYAEILSKSSMYDDCNERDLMYPVITRTQFGEPHLSIDFWGNEEWDGDGSVGGVSFRFREKGAGDGCARIHFDPSSGDTDKLRIKTIDLNKYPLLDDYPTIGTGTVTINLFGWERTDESSRPNSTHTVYAITAPADDLTDKTITAGTPSGTAKFPQEYPDNEAGAYPTVHTFSGLTADHVLLYVGITISNSSAGTSEGNLERLEITGVNYYYTSMNSSRSWAPTKPDGYDREYLQNPTNGLPSIMFTQKPYTALNFRVASEYIYSAGDTPLNVGRVAWGVVGIAENGVDWIAARYSKLNSRIELVSCRTNQETILTFWTPPAMVMDVMLDHRDGCFRIWYRTTGTTWIGPVITYHWDEATYGVISTSETGIMHTGIYGCINPPGFLTTGFNPTDADGIAMLASSDDTVLNAFAASGKLVMDERIYRYTGKTIRTGDYLGPYQGRQSWDYGEYSEGGQTYTGMATEIAAYFPDSDTDRVAGLLLAAENGHTWQIDVSDWTVVHYNSGTPNPLRNRSRHYSESCHGNLIGPPHRVHISPGLLNVEPDDSGGEVMHRYGARASVYGTDQLWVEKVVATTVDHDATVKDMIAKICKSASIKTEFPGDWTSASVAISGTPTQLASTTTLFPGGYDVKFTIPALSSGQWIAIYASNVLLDADGDLETTGDQEAIDFGIRNNGGILEVYSDPKSGYTDPEYFQSGVSPSTTHDVRILFHSEFCSIYLDNKWMMTFAYPKDSLIWPEDETLIYAYASGSNSITNVIIAELFDWREAIYVESEMSASSALGSVIQERPVEMTPTKDGGLAFSYDIIRDSFTYSADDTFKMWTSHDRDDRTSFEAGSDAVIYSADVDFVSNQDFADTEGFITRVFKLSALDTGAKLAGRLLLQKAWERQYMHSIVSRPDVRIEVGDKITFTYVVPGTSRNVNYTVIVEGYSINMEEGNYSMQYSAREFNA